MMATTNNEDGVVNKDKNDDEDMTTATTTTTKITNITYTNTITKNMKDYEDRIMIVRRYYERKGYRVHSGLQFGCELVLYADDPSKVHSDFCVHVVDDDGLLDWRMMQSLVRSMPDLHKTLILAKPRRRYRHCDSTTLSAPAPAGGDNEDAVVGGDDDALLDYDYDVDEIAMTTEHAPFRHKKQNAKLVKVGTQRKKQKQEQKQEHHQDQEQEHNKQQRNDGDHCNDDDGESTTKRRRVVGDDTDLNHNPSST